MGRWKIGYMENIAYFENWEIKQLWAYIYIFQTFPLWLWWDFHIYFHIVDTVFFKLMQWTPKYAYI